MVAPHIASRIEYPNGFSGSGDARYISFFVPVAEDASIGQIPEIRGATMLAADNVINLVRETGAVLVNPAVFAAPAGSLGDDPAYAFAYVTDHCAGSDGRAPSPSA